MNKLRFWSAGVAMLSALACFGWGQKGHDVTAYIAECHLTPAARTAVEKVLDGKSIVYYANWLDDASNTPDYAYSKTWHYKNVDAGVDYDSMSAEPKGDIVKALNEQISALRSHRLKPAEEALAVKMVVHLMGDIHQPMHMGHLSDRGGNQWKVVYFGREKNLHGIWDSDLPESVHKWSYTEWQQQIDRLSQDQLQALKGKTPDDWARETLKICTEVYNQTPQGARLSYDYLRLARPIIEQQLVTGGVRLADVLNSIYDPDGSR